MIACLKLYYLEILITSLKKQTEKLIIVTGIVFLRKFALEDMGWSHIKYK